VSSKDSFITEKKRENPYDNAKSAARRWRVEKFKRKKKVYYIILRKRLLPVRILYIALYPVAPKRIYIYIYIYYMSKSYDARTHYCEKIRFFTTNFCSPRQSLLFWQGLTSPPCTYVTIVLRNNR